MNDLQERLRSAFVDDAKENLEVAEARLLELSPTSSADDIATLFRAIHNIKGGAGSFGFQSISETAHGLETCLDQLRAGERTVTPALVHALLGGVDLLKVMLLSPDTDVTAQRHTLAQAIAALEQKPGAVADWVIEFTPPESVLAIGPDPLKLLAALDELGTVAVTVDATRVPPPADFTPTASYLTFTFRLPGTVAKAAIENVFDWVDGGWSVKAAATSQPAAPVGTEAQPLKPALREADASTQTAGQGRGSVRVPVEKLDQLMNMVGELVITQSILGEVDAATTLTPGRLARISEGLTQLARNTRMLQESVMRLRSQPLSVVFGRLPRIVHDLTEQLGKKVTLDITGEATELDKTVLEKLGDPLVHLVRNCVDHGLEAPAERLAAGKPEAGKLTVRAFGRGKDIFVEVSDDGRGLDEERILEKARAMGLVGADERPPSERILEFIFVSGLSTAKAVTNVSGRGVGMDVVRQNIQALGGDLTVKSVRGKGATFSLRLPLSLAIMEGQLVRVGARHYVIPLLSIIESIQPDWANVQPCGHQRTYQLRGELIPMVDLRRVLVDETSGTDALLVVVDTERGHLGLLVDELLSQQQVVVKSLEANYGMVSGLAGATILGDGSVSLILEPNGLMNRGLLLAAA